MSTEHKGTIATPDGFGNDLVDWPDVLQEDKKESRSPDFTYRYSILADSQVVRSTLEVIVFGVLIKAGEKFWTSTVPDKYRQECLEEAQKLGTRAENWLNRSSIKGKRRSDFEIHYYSRWHSVPVDSRIIISEDTTDSNKVVMETQLSRINGEMGIPTSILEQKRRIPSGDYESADKVFATIARRFGKNPEIVLQEMVDMEQPNFMYDVIRQLPEGDLLRVIQEKLNKGSKPRRLIWDALTREQRAFVRSILDQSRDRTRLSHDFRMPLSHGLSKAEFVISCRLSRKLGLSPNFTSLEINKDQPQPDPHVWNVLYDADCFYASVYPLITEDTRHGDLLEIRRQAQAICREFGFTNLERDFD